MQDCYFQLFLALGNWQELAFTADTVNVSDECTRMSWYNLFNKVSIRVIMSLG